MITGMLSHIYLMANPPSPLPFFHTLGFAKDKSIVPTWKWKNMVINRGQDLQAKPNATTSSTLWAYCYPIEVFWIISAQEYTQLGRQNVEAESLAMKKIQENSDMLVYFQALKNNENLGWRSYGGSDSTYVDGFKKPTSLDIIRHAHRHALFSRTYITWHWSQMKVRYWPSRDEVNQDVGPIFGGCCSQTKYEVE